MRKKELEQELAYVTEELKQIKEVLAIFLDNVYNDVDEITPEDLEYKLRELEVSRYTEIIKNSSPSSVGNDILMDDIAKLCATLGWNETLGISKALNIRNFIKYLARENHRLKMEGAKQGNANPRSDNLGTSDTTAIER